MPASDEFVTTHGFTASGIGGGGGNVSSSSTWQDGCAGGSVSLEIDSERVGQAISRTLRNAADAEPAESLLYPRIRRAVYESPWLVTPGMLATICEVVEMRARGERFSAAEVQDRVAAARRDRMVAQGGGEIAVIPIVGVMIPRADAFSEMSGAVNTQRIGQAIRRAVADPGIAAIVLDIDSPGGMAAGTPELADIIYQSRGRKPIVAVANTLAASAAYWVGTAADELVVSPSGEVGSVGVLAAHVDWSGYMEMSGQRVTYISAGKYKTEMNPYEPLGDEARAYAQSQIDDIYNQFVRTIARNRKASVDTIRSSFGEGRTVFARQAVAAGMADRVATLDEVIADLQKPKRGQSGAAADASLASGAIEATGDMERRRRRLQLAQA